MHIGVALSQEEKRASGYVPQLVFLWETHEEAITVIHVGADSCWTEGSHSDSTGRILRAFAHTLLSTWIHFLPHL